MIFSKKAIDNDIIKEAMPHYIEYLRNKLDTYDYNELRNYQIDKMKLDRAIIIANGGDVNDKS